MNYTTMNASSSTTSHEWLKHAQKILADAGIPTARLDALVMLEDVTSKDRAFLLAEPNTILNQHHLTALNDMIERRRQHEPLSYIRGKSEFYGRSFIITNHTLEPRPETETMIGLCRQLLHKPAMVADIGTGSGCIAITLQLEVPFIQTYGIDVDEGCIQVASQNAHLLGASTKFVQGSLLEPFFRSPFSRNTPFMITANLPYVPDSYHINRAARHEPRHAIYGGSDGLEYYRKLFEQCEALPVRPTYIATESLPPQHTELQSIADKHGYRLHISEDFIQVFVTA